VPAEIPPRSASVGPGIELDKVGSLRPRDYLIRFALGACVSIGAGVIAQTVGARFGGVFLAFPAILPASLTLIEEKEGTRRADRNAIGAVLGGIALIVFAGIGEVVFGRLPAAVALFLVLCGWVGASALLYTLLAVVCPAACDRAKD
jgi:hypothetical protein